MRRRVLFYFTIIIFIFFGCKKKENVYTSSKMNGNWIWIGNNNDLATPPVYKPTDIFTQFAVTVINETSVLVEGDTLEFKSIYDSSHAIVFEHDHSYGYRINRESLFYYTVSNSMTYIIESNYSYGGTTIYLSTTSYKPNLSVKQYVVSIVGIRSLSGTVYDTSFNSLSPNDTMYHITQLMMFSAKNDSTITFDNDVLGTGDNVLHYKFTDDVAKTITFQTFHFASVASHSVSTLTYNYETQKINFDQHDYVGYLHKRVVLE